MTRRYPETDAALLSVDSLNDERKSQLFTLRVFGIAATMPTVPFFFSTSTLEIGEEVSDF